MISAPSCLAAATVRSQSAFQSAFCAAKGEQARAAVNAATAAPRRRHAIALCVRGARPGAGRTSIGVPGIRRIDCSPYEFGKRQVSLGTRHSARTEQRGCRCTRIIWRSSGERGKTSGSFGRARLLHAAFPHLVMIDVCGHNFRHDDDVGHVVFRRIAYDVNRIAAFLNVAYRLQ